jgi:CheY-like chemotaxis protein
MATVLIVEDEFAIVDLLEMALADEGYRVLTAANGHQGLERLVAGPRPDLVIADYMMPVLDGAGLLRAMRETETHRNIRAMPEANVRERIGGFAAFVRKPFQLTAVVQLVATIVTTSRPAS